MSLLTDLLFNKPIPLPIGNIRSVKFSNVDDLWDPRETRRKMQAEMSLATRKAVILAMEGGSQTYVDIAKGAGIHKKTAEPIILRLEREGLCQRIDPRRFPLRFALTAAGGQS